MRKLLFVCSRNRIRSLAAERLFENRTDVQVRSRGTEKNARIRVSAGDIGWADEIFGMEKRHAERLRVKHGEFLEGKRLVVLRIKDIYQPGEARLDDCIKSRLRDYDLSVG